MRQFHKLTVSAVARETDDSLRISLDVPPDIAGEFEFLPGQHLPIQVMIDGRALRRTYSISSSPGQMPLELGVRIQPGGQVSEYLAASVSAGDELEVMPPFGQFHANPNPDNAKQYLAFAAGSGITPIIAICRALLECEERSSVTLFYGNRQQKTTMFIDDLYALKNRFPERLQLAFLFSREEQEFELLSGRLDEEKSTELINRFVAGTGTDEAFICGPDTMIESVTNSLLNAGLDEQYIHAERYGAPRQKSRPVADVARGDEHEVQIRVIMDGHNKTFSMSSDGPAIVDAAAQQGVELPFSCKAGVCATCRTHVRKGKVRMDVNYGLEPWEIEKGFVLACQSHPESDDVVLDYDKT